MMSKKSREVLKTLQCKEADAFSKHIEARVYKGPEVWPEYLGSHLTSLIDDLGTMKECDGSLMLVDNSMTSLGNLESVKGDLCLFNTKVTQAPNLKVVEDQISLLGASITMFSALEKVSSVDLYEEACIPFMPKLKGDCEIVFEGNIFMAPSQQQEGAPYWELVDSILGKDLTELLVLRGTDPGFSNLIDARLKGFLKRKPT